MTRNKPIVKLTGIDGNAFAIIGAVRVAMREAGWTKIEIKTVSDEMMSGDYDDLLCVVADVCEVE